MKYLLSICFSLVSMILFAQQDGLDFFHTSSSHTSFPDTARAAGHKYNNILYDAATHYSDSSVLIISPKKLNASKKVNMVFWFHGWFNNIDTAVQYYELAKQFVASQVNAVLVLAETTKNAPDSYGGKLEYDNVFKDLVGDVMTELIKQKKISKKCEPGNIILAGHSGAYRVISFILERGNMPVQEVVLFDALYGQTDKYLNWIQANRSNRFIDIYTDGGGTDAESREMTKKLTSLKINIDSIEEKELTSAKVASQPILFIHSLHKHNDVINKPDNFQIFLENSPFLEKLRK